MSNEKFKVKFGLAVGDTVATVDGTTGNIVTAGDAAINGGDITTTSTTANIVNTTATTVNIAGAGTTVSIGADTGTTTINNTLVADEVSVPGNLIAGKGVYAKGTMDATFTDGVVVDYATGNARISTGSADTLTFYNGGVANTTLGQFSTAGDLTITGDLRINGNDIKASDGVIAQTLVPLTSNNPNTDFSGNIVKGELRTGTAESTGNIYSMGGILSTGVSIDNTDKVADRTSLVLRNFGASLAGALPRNTVTAEAARGTSATPLNLTNGNVLVDIQGTGYTSTGWISDSLNTPASVIRLLTTEAWSNGLNNVGTGFQVLLQPTATTLTSGGPTIQQTISANPQTFASRSDAFTWANGKTGTTQTMALDVNGNLTVTGDVRINGNDIQASDGSTNITLTSNTLTAFAGDIQIGGNDILTQSGTTAITLTNTTGDVQVTGDLNILGGDITNTSGALQIATASNGNITLAPNGTGNVAVSVANGGNLTNTRNYLLGSVRDATTLAAGNIYALQSTISPTRGVSLSNNGAETTFRPGILMRSYSGGASTPRSWIVSENARGTAASPSAIQSGDRFCELMAQGYNGTSWSGDAVLGNPFLLRASATENWSASPSRAGTKFEVIAQPQGVNYTASTPMNIIDHQPTAAVYRADTWDFRTRTAAAGGTNISQLSIDSSGNLTATGNVTVNGGTINGPSSGILNIVSTDHINISNPNLTHFNKSPSSSAGISLHPGGDADNTDSLIYSSTFTSDGSKFSRSLWNTFRTTDGINFTPTQMNDLLGQFGFNGNYATGTTPTSSNLSCQIFAGATENWTSTQQGAQMVFYINKQGTTTSYPVIIANPNFTSFTADNIAFNNAGSGAGLYGDNIIYNRVYGQWQYNTTVTPAASNTAYVFPIGTADFTNIASVGSTSHIIPGAPGMYKLQFSVQVANSDNGSEHTAYIWWRKNGTDIPASMGRVTVPKGGATIAGWDNMISSANTTDYWELAYAADDATHISFPFYASTAFGPSTAALFTTLVPIGA